MLLTMFTAVVPESAVDVPSQSWRPCCAASARVRFTLKGSSWLDQIETWFGIITRQAIRLGTFANVQVLIRAIRAYMACWDTNLRPFQWTATTDKILAKSGSCKINIKKLVANNSK